MKVKIPTLKDSLGTRSMKYCRYHPRKKARVWTGHLILNGKSVFVGYCGNECSGSNGMPEGCKGNYRGAKS